MMIFLDDERYPADTGKFAKAKIVRSFAEFTALVDKNKRIDGVSFDHDLGYNEKTGMDCAHYLVNADMDRDILTRDFVLSVHSMNPVGKMNIEMLLANYLCQKFPDMF